MVTEAPDPRFTRSVLLPFPSIYHCYAQDTYPFRCPACGSATYSGEHVYLDESFSWSMSPSMFRKDDVPSDLAFQRYVLLTCSGCHYRTHLRPEGRWYQTQHPSGRISTYLGPLRAPTRPPTDPAPRRNWIYVGNWKETRPGRDTKATEQRLLLLPDPGAIRCDERRA